jgi:hypothetical protein
MKNITVITFVLTLSIMSGTANASNIVKAIKNILTPKTLNAPAPGDPVYKPDGSYAGHINKGKVYSPEEIKQILIEKDQKNYQK